MTKKGWEGMHKSISVVKGDKKKIKGKPPQQSRSWCYFGIDRLMCFASTPVVVNLLHDSFKRRNTGWAASDLAITT